MKSYDPADEYLDEKLKFTLECVGARKEQIFSKLHESGLSEDEIKELIGAWRLKSEWPKRRAKKNEPVVLPGIAACLHVFELLSFTVSQETTEERLSFKDSLADLGAILLLLGHAVLCGDGEGAWKEFREKFQFMSEQIARAEKRVKRQGTEKARKTKKQRADENRAAVVAFYKEMKKKTQRSPGILLPLNSMTAIKTRKPTWVSPLSGATS